MIPFASQGVSLPLPRQYALLQPQQRAPVPVVAPQPQLLPPSRPRPLLQLALVLAPLPLLSPRPLLQLPLVLSLPCVRHFVFTLLRLVNVLVHMIRGRRPNIFVVGVR